MEYVSTENGITAVLTPVTGVKVKKTRRDAIIPAKAHETDAGYDLYAAEDVIIEPGETVIVPTGIAVELPPGYAADVRPRSGITVRTKLRVQYGTIDESYTKEIGIIVDNSAQDFGAYCDGWLETIGASVVTTEKQYPDNTYIVRKGDRLAQLVIRKQPVTELMEVDDLADTGRGGFGSTGTNSERKEDE